MRSFGTARWRHTGLMRSRIGSHSKRLELCIGRVPRDRQRWAEPLGSEPERSSCVLRTSPSVSRSVNTSL
jgi:hypothetical protein